MTMSIPTEVRLKGGGEQRQRARTARKLAAIAAFGIMSAFAIFAQDGHAGSLPGEELFAKYCSDCHAQPEEIRPDVSIASSLEYPPLGMPEFVADGILTPAEVQAISDYVRAQMLKKADKQQH